VHVDHSQNFICQASMNFPFASRIRFIFLATSVAPRAYALRHVRRYSASVTGESIAPTAQELAPRPRTSSVSHQSERATENYNPHVRCQKRKNAGSVSRWWSGATGRVCIAEEQRGDTTAGGYS
jgi:hypothetical protein